MVHDDYGPARIAEITGVPFAAVPGLKLTYTCDVEGYNALLMTSLEFAEGTMSPDDYPIEIVLRGRGNNRRDDAIDMAQRLARAGYGVAVEDLGEPVALG